VISSLKNQYSALNQKYGAYIPALFFLLGVLFDMLTLGRIDQLSTLIQEAVFLFLIALFLYAEINNSMDDSVGGSKNKFLKDIWRYRVEISHFLLGGLLSAFTIFYFKSSSNFFSLLFILFLVLILISNELSFFKSRGPWLRLVIFSLCTWSYFNILIPVLLGSISVWIFLLSSLVVFLVMFVFIFFATKKENENRRKGFLSGMFIPVLGIILYFLEAIPPVPLSVQYMGIYHGVEKQDGSYILSRQRPWWKFWQNGDQDFYFRKGDKVYVFTRVFSPTEFKHKIKIRWEHQKESGDYQLMDVIPFGISGGREMGYRGYAYKQNIIPGSWRVFVETEDEREISRINFEVLEDKSVERRSFVAEVH
jgi:hypothetical protein